MREAIHSKSRTHGKILYWSDWAEKRGVSRSQVDRAMQGNHLPFYRFGRWRYLDENDGEDWLEAHRVGHRSSVVNNPAFAMPIEAAS